MTIDRMMREQLTRQKNEEQKAKLGTIQAKEFKYYCPFCYQFTDWSQLDRQTESETQYCICHKCKSEGSLAPMTCSRCLNQSHVYRDKDNQCSLCAKNVGPKDVISFKVFNCFFCKNKP